jgi:outer membrane protein assembly factor BamB
MLRIFFILMALVSVGLPTVEAQKTSPPHSAVQGWTSFRGNPQSSGAAATLPSTPTFTSLKQQWTFELADGGFESSAAIVDQTVYIAGITNDVKGKLFAIDLNNGRTKWQFDSPDGFITTPLYHDGRLFLGDMLGVFRCIDDQGKPCWEFKTDVEINSSANVHGDHVLFGSQNATLYCLSQSTGELVWRHEVNDQIQSSITLAGDRVFLAGCDGLLHIINAIDGKQLGTLEIESPTIATPAVQGDAAFFGTEKADVFAVDARTMKLKWKRPDPKGGTSIRSSAAVAPGHVIFGGRNRKLVSLNPDDGQENWTVTLKNKIDSSPIIVGNRVIAASTDGRLYIIDLSTGKEIWQKQFNGSFIGSPAFAQDRIIIATDQGTVYCLSLQK